MSASEPNSGSPLDNPDTGRELEEEPMLRWFQHHHLNEPMRSVSALYNGLATLVVTSVPRSPERTVALRKLLESKDAAVRAVLPL